MSDFEEWRHNKAVKEGFSCGCSWCVSNAKLAFQAGQQSKEQEIDEFMAIAVDNEATIATLEARNKELEEDKKRIRAIGGVKCFACPECNEVKTLSDDSLGHGFRECYRCGQEWWIDIDYSLTARERYDQLKFLVKASEASNAKLVEALRLSYLEHQEDSAGDDTDDCACYLCRIYLEQPQALKENKEPK